MALNQILGNIGKAVGNVVSNVAQAAKAQPGQNTSYINSSGQKTPGVYMDAAGKPDIGSQITSGISGGMSYQQVQNLLSQRDNKIASDPSLAKYQNDAITRAAQDYIWQGKMNEQMQDMQNYYSQIAAQQEAAKRAQVERAVGGLEGQKGGINQSYSDLFRQLYVDKMKSEKTLPQQMAAMGYTGGLTESAAMDIQNSYANSLRQGEQQRLSTLSEIDRAVVDARLQGDISIAEQAAQLAQQRLMGYTDLMNRQQEQQNWEKTYGLQKDQMTYDQLWKQKGWDYEVGQDQYSKDREMALTLANAGNYTALARLWGMSEGDAKGLADNYARQNLLSEQEAARGLADWYAQYGDFSRLKDMGVNVNLNALKSGGSGGSKVSYNKEAYDTALDLAMKGDTSDGVRKIIEGYTKLPFDMVLKSYGYASNFDKAKSELDSLMDGLRARGTNQREALYRITGYLEAANLSKSEKDQLAQYVAEASGLK